MKRINNLLRSIFIGPEFLIILLSIFLFYFYKEFYILLTTKLIENNGRIIQYFLPIVTSCLVASFLFFEKIRLPKDDNKYFLNWKEYTILIDTAYIGLCYNLISTITTFIIYIYYKDIKEEFISSIFLASILIIFISTFTMFLAKIKIRELIERHS